MVWIVVKPPELHPCILTDVFMVLEAIMLLHFIFLKRGFFYQKSRGRWGANELPAEQTLGRERSSNRGPFDVRFLDKEKVLKASLYLHQGGEGLGGTETWRRESRH